jgi:Kdo2-lipid IVA lauroyltransferase/acyltransferase
MLVDQYLTNGVEVTFFGRKTSAQSDAGPAAAADRVPDSWRTIIRLPGRRFRAELSEEVKPVRDTGGQIDFQGTMQAITTVIESWICEYPDQWLRLHRRWQ